MTFSCWDVHSPSTLTPTPKIPHTPMQFSPENFVDVAITTTGMEGAGAAASANTEIGHLPPSMRSPYALAVQSGGFATPASPATPTSNSASPSYIKRTSTAGIVLRPSNKQGPRLLFMRSSSAYCLVPRSNPLHSCVTGVVCVQILRSFSLSRPFRRSDK